MKQLSFDEAILKRRSQYHLTKLSSDANAEIINSVEFCMDNYPSAFNSQSVRVMILFDEEHQKLWDLVLKELKKITPEQNQPQMIAKNESFKQAHGTILFFTDLSVIEGLQTKFPPYFDQFPIWGQEAQGILQFMIWTKLTTINVGVSLQHYSTLINNDVKEAFNVPQTWQLIAQMPFGKIVEPAAAKDKVDLSNKLIIKP
jgi:predicted oxidoreductase (fatty acid repression mutant protein)